MKEFTKKLSIFDEVRRVGLFLHHSVDDLHVLLISMLSLINTSEM